MHIRNIDLNLLVVFQHLMRERSVTKAATSIGMSQSGVSHALARLRDLTSDPLFLREQRALIPTPRAYEMLDLVEPSLASIKQAIIGQSDFNAATDTSSFTLMLPDLGETLVLPKIMGALAKEAPNIHVNIRPGFGRAFKREIENGGIHVAMELQPSTDKNIKSVPWFSSDLVAVTSKNTNLSTTYLDQKTYSAAKHVLYRPEGLDEPPLDLLLKSRGIERSYSTTISTMFGLVFAVAETDMVATIPRILAERLMPLLQVKIFRLPFLEEKAQAYLWWSQSLDSNARSIWLREQLLANAL